MFNNISNPLAGYRALGRPVGRKVCSWMLICLGFIKGNTVQKEKIHSSVFWRHEKKMDHKHRTSDSKLATTFRLKEQQQQKNGF